MAWIKIAPAGDPNAEGEWIKIPVTLPHGMKWPAMELRIRPHIPAGYQLVAAQRGPRERLNAVRKL
jgi:hypothetical protein